MLSRATLGGRRLMLMFRTSFGGRRVMLMLSCTAIRRCRLMLTSGFASFFGQVRRRSLDAKGLDPRHHDWRRGSSKRTGRVVTRDHHGIIPCQQGADTQ